jgi:hypothetical protein
VSTSLNCYLTDEVKDWNTGSQYNDTSNSTWTSSATSVATVQKGLVQGVSAGSVSVGASYPYDEPQYTSYWCEGSSWSCPLYVTTPQGSAPGTVQRPTSLKFLSVTVLPNGTSGAVGQYDIPRKGYFLQWWIF